MGAPVLLQQQLGLLQVRNVRNAVLGRAEWKTQEARPAEASQGGRRMALLRLGLGMGLGMGMEMAGAAAAEEEQQRRRPRPVSSPFDEDRLLEQNRRMQRLNNAPEGFPGFIREGFEVKVVVTSEYVSTESGLIYLDIEPGQGDPPQKGQQVLFHYTGYNESGRKVDSSYQQGTPARTRIGINGMIPGFEEGISSMRAGGKRRIVVPPELGPPVGPSTFFSAKQFEVFDVELLSVQDCTRRTVLGFYSDVVCSEK